MVVKGQLLAALDLFLCVVEALLDDFFVFGGSLDESVFERGEAWSVDEEEVAVNLVVVDLLAALDIDVENADLLHNSITLPRFMMSINLPLCVP